jgi:hypothetical protein
MKYFNLLPFLFLISSCSSLSTDKETTLKDTVLGIFSDNYDEVNLAPEDAIKYQCANNESFYLRYLEENNAVWVILKNREFRLDRIESENKSYANNTTTLDIKGSNAIIKVDASILYKKCQNNYEEEPIEDNNNVDVKATKEIKNSGTSNNTDLIQNDDQNHKQDIDQDDLTESSWLEKLKFWEEETIDEKQ